MNCNQYIETLRIHILDMARLCQRGVDYSIKAYQLGCAECSFRAQVDTYDIDILHREVLDISRELMLMGISELRAIRCIMSADRICNALKAIHVHGADIASSSMRLVESCRLIGCKNLVSMGDFVNGLVRLCVVALLDEETQHAETVLRKDGIEREFQKEFFEWFRALDRCESTQAGCEIAIAKSLSQMARELQEVANAILFWLNDPEQVLASGNRVGALHRDRSA